MGNSEDSTSAIRKLWKFSNLEDTYLDKISLTGSEPILPSVYKTGVVSQSSITVAAMAAAKIWESRTGESQKVSVDMKHAAIAFRSERYLDYESSKYGSTSHSGMRNHPDSIHGFYVCGDGGWLQIHANYPAHRNGVLEALDSEASVAGVQKV
ncbi:MAG TPA: CoA transferase, partial [Dehalococcoidia bacterium]|nr:CoA transferase [Dehalococcoidia bacterium]